MTEGYQPPNRGNSTADQDTTTLPRLSSGAQPAGSQGAAAGSGAQAPWQPAARPADEPPAQNGGLSSKLAAAASTSTANARGAARNAADEAENRAGRQPRGRSARQPRRARLTLSHVNVYSVFKFSCVLAIALFLVWLIMIGVLYGILDVAGVFSKINDTVHTISGDGKTNNYVTGPLVFGGAIIIGAVYIVLFIAISTIGAMIYNLCADLVGGAEVTLSERE